MSSDDIKEMIQREAAKWEGGCTHFGAVGPCVPCIVGALTYVAKTTAAIVLKHDYVELNAHENEILGDLFPREAGVVKL